MYESIQTSYVHPQETNKLNYTRVERFSTLMLFR